MKITLPKDSGCFHFCLLGKHMTRFILESWGWGQRVTGCRRSITTETLKKRNIRSVLEALLCLHACCIFALSMWRPALPTAQAEELRLVPWQ